MMTTQEDQHHRFILQRIARRAMIERGLLPDFSAEAIADLQKIKGNAHAEGSTRDLRTLLWCSIDNDDSRDLDQLTVALALPGEAVKILVAIADVDALVKKESALDDHARHNTTSVYTAAQIFPMLPEKLSTDLSSLNIESDRSAVVVEMTVGGDGSLQSSDIYPAIVRNHARLAYNSVADWLENGGLHPLPAISLVNGLAENLRIQDRVAHMLRTLRHQHGALELETIEARPVFTENEVTDVEVERKNRAKEIIEDFMIAANGISARYLASKNFPSLRRVVRTPKRWNRIVEIAAERKYALPEEPDSKALDQFLVSAKAADPLHFPDLCLSIIKLLGPGEYVVELPGGSAAGHFGLAVKDYTHSTAPNRRYPDLITQRMLKAAISRQPCPYANEELDALAKHCTQEEDAAKKVERQVEKSALAIVMESKIGNTFDAIVTGASAKGTWVRLLNPPVEGRLESGFEGVDVGHRLRVELIYTDVERGYIDFKRVQ